MPVSHIRRSLRRATRRARHWSTIAKLTLAGNVIEKSTKLKNARHPVLMLYGFGATRRTLAILEKRLKNDGYTIFSLNLGGFAGTFNTDSIEDTARLINDKIEKMYTKFGFRGRLSVIGHSKGGLIGQYYIKFLSGSHRVKTFVTLGTPHNGTPWSTLARYTPLKYFAKSLVQMAPDSAFLQKLKGTPFPKTVKVYSVYSKADSVCPYPGSVLEEASNVKNIELFNVTHSELLIKKNVYNAIKHALKQKMPESWTEASQQSYEEHLREQGHVPKLRLLKK